jgi:tripartite-type tricarboxylate transporter receptor subunit TctC
VAICGTTLADFALIGRIAYAPFVLAVNQKVPASTLQELVAFAKSHPGQLTYATAGSGTMSQLAVEFLSAAAGIDMLAVHYKGASSAVFDLVAAGST